MVLQPFHRPIVSVRFTPRTEAIFWGFQYHNAGPGTAFRVRLEPLIANGFRATFATVEELRAGEFSEYRVAHVECVNEKREVSQDNLEALVGEVPLPLVLTYEDGLRAEHREEYEIATSGYIGPIKVSRKLRVVRAGGFYNDGYVVHGKAHYWMQCLAVTNSLPAKERVFLGDLSARLVYRSQNDQFAVDRAFWMEPQRQKKTLLQLAHLDDGSAEAGIVIAAESVDHKHWFAISVEAGVTELHVGEWAVDVVVSAGETQVDALTVCFEITKGRKIERLRRLS